MLEWLGYFAATLAAICVLSVWRAIEEGPSREREALWSWWMRTALLAIALTALLYLGTDGAGCASRSIE